MYHGKQLCMLCFFILSYFDEEEVVKPLLALLCTEKGSIIVARIHGSSGSKIAGICSFLRALEYEKRLL